MQQYRLALIGFGNVGRGLATILRDYGRTLAHREGADFRIMSVNTARHSSLYEPGGLDPAALLAAVGRGGRLDELPARHKGWDASRIVAESNADVVIEMTPTDTATAEPATTTIREALERGRHVVTVNKGPIALHYAELAGLAESRGVTLGVEGTVMGGTPVIRLSRELLATAGIAGIRGILNGTTNFILSRMETGESYAAALAEAQARGYAEADPTADVEGYDAAVKTVILGNLLLGGRLSMADVEREGITHLTPKDVAAARAEGTVWKLIGRVERDGDSVKAAVRPIRLPLSHPLAAVGGAGNAVTLTTRLLGDVTLAGPGAGGVETAYAVLNDLLALHRAGRRAAVAT